MHACIGRTQTHCLILTKSASISSSHYPVRFLRGEVSLSGEWTKGLVDLWQLHQRQTATTDAGYTFNALDQELVKRVRVGMCVCVYIHYELKSGVGRCFGQGG